MRGRDSWREREGAVKSPMMEMMVVSVRTEVWGRGGLMGGWGGVAAWVKWQPYLPLPICFMSPNYPPLGPILTLSWSSSTENGRNQLKVAE